MHSLGKWLLIMANCAPKDTSAVRHALRLGAVFKDLRIRALHDYKATELAGFAAPKSGDYGRGVRVGMCRTPVSAAGGRRPLQGPGQFQSPTHCATAIPQPGAAGRLAGFRARSDSGHLKAMKLSGTHRWKRHHLRRGTPDCRATTAQRFRSSRHRIQHPWLHA